MITDREPRGAVPVQVLERDEVIVHDAELVKSRVVVGDGVPRIIFHSSSTTDQGLVSLASKIDNSRSLLYDPIVFNYARAGGTTVSNLVNNGVTRYVTGIRTGVSNEENFGDGPLSPLIEQRAMRRLYREGKKAAAKQGKA